MKQGLILLILLIAMSPLSHANCGKELATNSRQPRIISSLIPRDIKTEINLIEPLSPTKIIASNSLYEVISSAHIPDRLEFLALREKVTGKTIAQADVPLNGSWERSASDYLFSLDGKHLLLGGTSRLDVLKIPSLEIESDLNLPGNAYIYALKAWSENFDIVFVTDFFGALNMYKRGAKPREIWKGERNSIKDPLIWNEKAKTLSWKNADGQTWIFDEQNCSRITKEPMPLTLTQPKKSGSFNMVQAWSGSSLEKEPGLEKYTLVASSDKAWKEISFEILKDDFGKVTTSESFVHAKPNPIEKNYWYNGASKLVESDDGLQFFEGPNSKPLKLKAQINKPDENPQWVIMADSKSALVGRRLDAYGAGDSYYFAKKAGATGRHLYQEFHLPVDPLLRFSLRLDSDLKGSSIQTVDLRSGKVLAKKSLAFDIKRQDVAISQDGEQLIAYTGPVFLIIKLHQGKRIETSAPFVFQENGLPANIVGVAFTKDGEPVVAGQNGVVRVYK